MTMVAACRFHDGAVIIADSRATWSGSRFQLFQDSLQKILSLGPRTAIAFAGDVQAADLVIRQLRRHITKKPRLSMLNRLAAEIPRVARHYYSLYQSKTGRRERLALVLAGVTASGSVKIWCFESPLFAVREVSSGFAVVGSGAVVAPYIQENLARFDRDLPNLKARVDALHVGLESELQKKRILTVGGLLQVISLDPTGIRPLRYGFLRLDPEAPAEAKSMEMKAGRWFQRDVKTGLEVPLMEPTALLRSTPIELRFHDYDLLPSETSTLKWHLTYFLTCLEVQSDIGTIEFRGVMSGLASPHYPLAINVLAAVGLWGSAGDHEIEFSLVFDGNRSKVLSKPIHIEYPEEMDLAFAIPLYIPAPSSAFLECHVSHQLLGRRALYFGQVSGEPPEDKAELENFAQLQNQTLRESQRSCSDPSLEESRESALVYLSLCQNCIDQDAVLRFERQMTAVYWKTYPLKLRLFIASAFRMPKGGHKVQVDLVDAATREVSTIGSKAVDSTSSCIVVPIHGELIAVVPSPGIYFVNAYVDGRLTGTTVLAAEGDTPRYSFNLPSDDLARVKAGELLLLLKRSKQKEAP